MPVMCCMWSRWKVVFLREFNVDFNAITEGDVFEFLLSLSLDDYEEVVGV
jgi:hypothetical protein